MEYDELNLLGTNNNKRIDPLYNIKEKIHTVNGNIPEAMKCAMESPECSGPNGSMMSKKSLLIEAINNCHKSNTGSNYHDTVTVLMKQNMTNNLNALRKDDPTNSNSNKNKTFENQTDTIDLIKTGLDKTFTPEQIIKIGMLWIDEYRHLFN